jgi:hypothetical protein
MRPWTAALLVGALSAAACAAAPEPAPRRALPAAPAPKPRPQSPPEWTHWEPLELAVRTNVARPDLPLQSAQIVRNAGAEQRWTAAPEELRGLVQQIGFAIAPAAEKRARHGARYVEIRETSAPFFVTFDALFHVAHLAMDRALADVEDRVLAPALRGLLVRLDARFAAEQASANADLAAAYTLARGIVAVALTLARGIGAPPPEIARAVAEEIRRIREAQGPADSALLGVELDYAAFAPRCALGQNEERAGTYRAMAWLANAPLMLATAGEIRGGVPNVARVRTHARAALLFAHAMDPDVDVEAAAAWARIARVAKFVSGAADDPSPADLAEVASKMSVDLRDARSIENVARVDRIRHAVVDRHVPRVYDGAGGLRAHTDDLARPGSLAIRASLGVRLFGARATPDAEVLQGIVFPAVGPLAIGAAPPTAREGRRALPTAMDVAAWLGSSEARLIEHETGDDAYVGFDDALEALYQRRPGETDASRHGSVYMSALDAIATYLASSEADKAQPMAQSAAWRRRKLEVALGAWTLLRHDVVSFARAPNAPALPILVNRYNASNVTGFVEPHPEALAKLVALVRQLVRGLETAGALGLDSPARPMLKDIHDLLFLAFRVALREANDEPLTGEEGAALAALPSRMAELEAKLGAIADVPRVVDVHVDAGGARVLEEATGYLDDLAVVMREPVSGRLVLAFGTAVPHYELSQPSSQRLSDDGWRARLDAGSAPRRHTFTGAYVVALPAEAR